MAALRLAYSCYMLMLRERLGVGMRRAGWGALVLMLVAASAAKSDPPTDGPRDHDHIAPTNPVWRSMQPGLWTSQWHQEELVLKPLPEEFLRSLPKEQRQLLELLHKLASFLAGIEKRTGFGVENAGGTVCRDKNFIAAQNAPQTMPQTMPGCTTRFITDSPADYLEETRCEEADSVLVSSRHFVRESEDRFTLTFSSTAQYKGELLFADILKSEDTRLSRDCGQ